MIAMTLLHGMAGFRGSHYMSGMSDMSDDVSDITEIIALDMAWYDRVYHSLDGLTWRNKT